MRRWTIAGLLGLVAMLALGMAALRDSEGEWAEIAPGVAATLLLIAAALAVLGRGRDRGCIVFAAIGGAYFVASWPIGASPSNVPIASGAVERIVLEFDAVANPEPPYRHERLTGTAGWSEFSKLSAAERSAVKRELTFDDERNRLWEHHRPKRLNFGRKIAHAWLSLALGGLAALAAALIFGRRSRYDGSGRESISRDAGTELAPEGVDDVNGHL